MRVKGTPALLREVSFDAERVQLFEVVRGCGWHQMGEIATVPIYAADGNRLTLPEAPLRPSSFVVSLCASLPQRSCAFYVSTVVLFVRLCV